MKSSERISFTAPNGTYDAIRDYADERDLTLSQVVRAGLRAVLPSDEREDAPTNGKVRPKAPHPQPRRNGNGGP